MIYITNLIRYVITVFMQDNVKRKFNPLKPSSNFTYGQV
jgi:hypothetical protein